MKDYLLDQAPAPPEIYSSPPPSSTRHPFNHYLGDPVEQVDYPRAGRITMTDFTDTWKRASDTVAFVTLLRLITQARRDGRRIWLVQRSPRYDAVRAWLNSPMTLRMTTTG